MSENQVLLNLPENLVFRLAAQSETAINQVVLRYRTNARLCQEVNGEIRPNFDPGQEIEAEWEWDFQRTGTLPPGAQLSWQWELTDRNGQKTTTAWQEIIVQDRRHRWRQLQDGLLTLQWYERSEAEARKLLGFARKGLEKLQADTGVQPSSQVWITIYPDYASLQEYLALSTEWTGGRAYPEYNSILLGVPDDALAWAEEALPHELAHLVVAEQTFNCLGTYLPVWLNEGLAVNVEGDIPPEEKDIVLQALKSGKLPGLASLSNSFSPYPDEANRSYTQSGMVVQFLVDTYGSEKLGQVLQEVKRGQTVDEALQSIYGLNTASLDAAWRRSLGFAMPTPAPTHPVSRTPIPTLPLWTPLVKKSNALGANPTPSPTHSEAALETASTLPAVASTPTFTVPAIQTEDVNGSTIPWLNWTILVCLAGIAVMLMVGWVFLRRKSKP